MSTNNAGDNFIKYLQDTELMKTANHFSSIKESLKIPPLKTKSFEMPRNLFLADYQYEIIRKTIIDFESKLDESNEIAVKLTSFGQTVVLHISDLGYSNPSLIHFYGALENGTRAELIQHVNQISFLLLAVPKSAPEKPPRRIGFDLKPAEIEHLELDEE